MQDFKHTVKNVKKHKRKDEHLASFLAENQIDHYEKDAKYHPDSHASQHHIGKSLTIGFVRHECQSVQAPGEKNKEKKCRPDDISGLKPGSKIREAIHHRGENERKG